MPTLAAFEILYDMADSVQPKTAKQQEALNIIHDFVVNNADDLRLDIDVGPLFGGLA